MGYRGGWNILYQGKIYQHVTEYARIPEHTDPHDIARVLTWILHDVKRFQTEQNLMPFPLSLHRAYDCFYTLDIDHNTLTTKAWMDAGDDVCLDITLFRITTTSGSAHVERIYNKEGDYRRRGLPVSTIDNALSESVSEELEHELNGLSSHSNRLHLLRERLILDLLYQWRSFFYDEDNWSSSWLLHKTLCEALLWVASWDFTVQNDITAKRDIGKLPISPYAFPEWNPNAADIFWFHGYLIVMCADASDSTIAAFALERAKAFLENQPATVIVLSLPSLAVVTIESGGIRSTRPVPFLGPNPDVVTQGMHILFGLFTSVSCPRKRATVHGSLSLPMELWWMIFQHLDSSSRIKFAQTTEAFEMIYHSCLPELAGSKFIARPVNKWPSPTRICTIERTGSIGQLKLAGRSTDPVTFSISFRGKFSGLAYINTLSPSGGCLSTASSQRSFLT